MGMENRAGAAAAIGSCVHRLMELRALASIHEKKGITSFEYEDWGEITTEWAKDPNSTIDRAYAHQQKLDSHVKWEKIPKSKILKSAIRAITDYPEYDPINLNIIEVEQYFDLEIKEDWAKYSETVNGVLYEGYLRIKGTIDCIIAHEDNVIECYDFKNGLRKSFATGEIKTPEYLKNDHQLLFYLYALNRLYPGKHFIMTLYFINDGGIFPVIGDQEMLERAEKMIKDTYLEILSTKIPTVLDKTRRDWRCKSCCAFSKPASYTRGLSICEFMSNKFKQVGVDKTIEKYGNMDKVVKYGSGGGKVLDETKD